MMQDIEKFRKFTGENKKTGCMNKQQMIQKIPCMDLTADVSVLTL